jgi:hypothetical protein
LQLIPTRKGRSQLEVKNMFDIQNLINDTVVKSSTYKSAKRDGARFHFSDAGNCYRMRYFKRHGVEPTRNIEAKALLKMMAGEASHKQLQYLLARYSKIIMAEMELGNDDITGHPDGVLMHENIFVPVEFKTNEKWGMTHIRKHGAKKEHELQLFTNWSFLRKIVPTADNAALVYMKREDWETKTFNYIWNEEIQAKVDAEWQPLIGYWTRGEIPPCSCAEMYDGAGPKYCRYGETNTSCCAEALFYDQLAKDNPASVLN